MGLFSLPPSRSRSADEERQGFMVPLPDGRQSLSNARNPVSGNPVSPFGLARHTMPHSARSMLSQSYLTQMIIDALNGRKPNEDQALNEFTAMGLPLVWTCVRAKADAISTIPFRVVRRVKFDEYETVDAHPLNALLNDSPDDEMDAGSFKSALVHHLEMWGNYFANIGFNNKGTVNSLRLMLPLETTLRRQDGTLLYDWSDGTSTAYGISRWDVVHGRNVTFDGIVGLPPVTLTRESLGVPHAAAKFAGKFLRNMARPSVLVTYKGRLKDDTQRDNFATTLLAPVSGDNVGGAAVAFDEADIKTLTMPLEDAQFIETWEGTGFDVCRIYRVPPWKAYIKGGANYASSEQAALDWLTDSLAPLLSTIERTFGLKCLPKGLELQALDEDLRRGDNQSMFQAYGLARQWGLLTLNEIRRKIGMAGVEGGDTTFVPANQVTLEKAITQEQPQAANQPGNQGAENVNNQLLRSRVHVLGEMTMAARELLEPHVRSLAGIEADRLGKVRGSPDEVRATAAFWADYEGRASERLAPVVRGMAKLCSAAGLSVAAESELPHITQQCVQRLMATGMKGEQAAVAGSAEEQRGLTAMRAAAVAAVAMGLLLT